MNAIRLTTSDNPYDPFNEWQQWLNFDTVKGYHTCERLASITIVSDALSDEENEESIEQSMNELMKYGAIAKDGSIIEYKKVSQSNDSNKSKELISN